MKIDFGADGLVTGKGTSTDVVECKRTHVFECCESVSMQSMWKLLFYLAALGLAIGCRTIPTEDKPSEEFLTAFGNYGFSFSTLQALDKGQTNKAYHLTLIQLRENMLQLRALSRRVRLTESERHMKSSHATIVLNHIEQYKERAAREPRTTVLALEIIELLSQSLTSQQSSQRVESLKAFFNSRFVEERKALKKFLDDE